ncbi:hypothetical protein CB1_001095064 [Camelus ferus]|nr:hypothetical protein CB1_001095064 [Camelus ferus]
MRLLPQKVGQCGEAGRCTVLRSGVENLFSSRVCIGLALGWLTMLPPGTVLPESHWPPLKCPDPALLGSWAPDLHIPRSALYRVLVPLVTRQFVVCGAIKRKEVTLVTKDLVTLCCVLAVDMSQNKEGFMNTHQNSEQLLLLAL